MENLNLLQRIIMRLFRIDAEAVTGFQMKVLRVSKDDVIILKYDNVSAHELDYAVGRLSQLKLCRKVVPIRKSYELEAIRPVDQEVPVDIHLKDHEHKSNIQH